MNLTFASGLLPAVDSTRRRIERNRPLAPLTTIRIGGSAERYSEPRSVGELAELRRLALAEGWPVRVIGGGANLLVPDEGVRGLVINLGRMRQLIVQGTTIHADAGVAMARLVSESLGSGLSGLEGIAAIPGTVGGGIAMNAGGKYGELGDSVASVTVMTADGAIARLCREEVGFAYRSADLRGGIVLSAQFLLRRADMVTIRRRAAEISREKISGQPYDVPSAGCTFRNPPGGSAGRMLDQAGLKGFRVGNAGVSERHANFIVNLGGATASDVMKVAEAARARVREHTGVLLEYEIKRWAE